MAAWNSAAARTRLVPLRGDWSKQGPMGHLNKVLHKLAGKEYEAEPEDVALFFEYIQKGPADDVGWWRDKRLTVANATRISRLLGDIERAREWKQKGRQASRGYAFESSADRWASFDVDAHNARMRGGAT